jgi:hypothetical protein
MEKPFIGTQLSSRLSHPPLSPPLDPSPQVLQSPEIVWEGKWLVEENLFSLYASPFQMAGGDQVMKLTGAPLEVQLPLCGKPTDFLDWPAVRFPTPMETIANRTLWVWPKRRQKMALARCTNPKRGRGVHDYVSTGYPLSCTASDGETGVSPCCRWRTRCW